MPPKPRKLHRGERLDLYPATLPRNEPPPLTSEVIADSAHEVSADDRREVSTNDSCEVSAEIIADEPTSENTPELSTDSPLASTSHFPTYHFPPTYFFGWIYQEDEFYERFANKDDEDAWDIYEGFKELVTRPFRDKYPGMSVPNFDIEDESKECIVYIAYNLEERSLLKAQNLVLIDAAKDILEETREPMWYRRL